MDFSETIADCDLKLIELMKICRQDFIKKLIDSGILTDEYICQLREPEFLTQLTLDCFIAFSNS